MTSGNPSSSVTQLLSRIADGDREALDRLMPIVYSELRSIAHLQLRSERTDHTLNTTALVNEAYIRLARQNSPWQNRAHFFAIAAQAMRRILVNYAEKRNAQKRGGGVTVLSIGRHDLDLGDGASTGKLDLVLSVHTALEKLEAFNERGARVVEYRFFGGLSYEEIAEVLGISPITVRRSWSFAQAWLRKELGDT